MSQPFTVLGAGVLGLAVATELTARGIPVRIVDPAGGPGEHGCSWWAGGMLAPFCERESAEEPVQRLGQDAIAWWERHTGGVTRAGTLVVTPARDRRELDRFARRTETGESLGPERIAELEPDLAGRFDRALFFAAEAHLDPRAALAALQRGLAARGVTIATEAPEVDGGTDSGATGAQAHGGTVARTDPGRDSDTDTGTDTPLGTDPGTRPASGTPLGTGTDPGTGTRPASGATLGTGTPLSAVPDTRTGLPPETDPAPHPDRATRSRNPATPARIIDCRGLAARDILPGLRGVRGEMLVLRCPDVALLRPVRLLHPRVPIYLVPRGDGLYMLGATMIESDRRGVVTARSVLELLSAAYALHPAFGEAEIVQLGADARPAFPDNLPRIGRVALADGTTRLYANGLYRHGYLLAPALAMQMADHIETGAKPEFWHETDDQR